jgi:iron complex outermembrane receptor protein
MKLALSLSLDREGDISVNFFLCARNVFDVDYFEQLAVPSGNMGLIVGQPGYCQTYGLTIKAEF